MKRLLVILLGSLFVLSGTAAAFTYDDSEGVYRPPGSHLTLGTETVPPSQQGLVCDVTVDLGNNESTRPGSDIVIVSGTSLAAFPDTEATAGDPGPVVVRMELGSTIDAILTFGPNHEYDGHGYDNAAFSGFGTVTIGTCAVPPSPTVPPTTPTVPPTAPVVPPTPVHAAPVHAAPVVTG